MNAKILTQEQISAFADGEMADSHVELVLAALRQDEGRAVWDAYHHIGDVLRSEEMAFKLRPDFMASMSARLEEEPTIVAPSKVMHVQMEQAQMASGGAMTSRRLVQRFAFPGIAAIAVTTLALISGPQLLVAMRGGPTSDSAPVMVASTSRGAAQSAGAVSAAASQTVAIAVNAQQDQDGAVLRDPRIDDYLLAHQRFSPSVFSTAQYARTATFSTDSNK